MRDVKSLGWLFQVAVQGGILLAKAASDPAPAREAIDHLERYAAPVRPSGLT